MTSGDHHSHDHTELPDSLTLKVQTLESLLVENGLVYEETLDALIETYEHKVGPRNGSHVVAKAWTDPEFKAWLLKYAPGAIASLGFCRRHGWAYAGCRKH